MSNPPIGRKPGRPVDPYLAIYRALFTEWSARTVARYALCMRRLRLMEIEADEWRAVVAKATRPNGTINVARLDEITETMAAIWLACQQDAPIGGTIDPPPVGVECPDRYRPKPRR